MVLFSLFFISSRKTFVEGEFKPPSEDESSDADSSGVDEDEISEPSSESDPETPVKNRKRKRPPVANGNSTSKSARKVLPPSSMEEDDAKTRTPVVKKAFGTPSVSSNTKSRLAAFQAVEVCWEI